MTASDDYIVILQGYQQGSWKQLCYVIETIQKVMFYSSYKPIKTMYTLKQPGPAMTLVQDPI